MSMSQHISEWNFTAKQTLKLPHKYSFDSFFLDIGNQQFTEDPSSSALAYVHKAGTNMLLLQLGYGNPFCLMFCTAKCIFLQTMSNAACHFQVNTFVQCCLAKRNTCHAWVHTNTTLGEKFHVCATYGWGLIRVLRLQV